MNGVKFIIFEQLLFIFPFSYKNNIFFSSQDLVYTYIENQNKIFVINYKYIRQTKKPLVFYIPKSVMVFEGLSEPILKKEKKRM